MRHLRTAGNPVGEDASVALASVHHRHVVVYIANAAPRVYTPVNNDVRGSPVTLAFYEPGHYRAVIPAVNVQRTQGN